MDRHALQSVHFLQPYCRFQIGTRSAVRLAPNRHSLVSPRAFPDFLDNSSLSANPALWQAIESALGQSEYFLLFASTLSAQSPWVTKEIDWWLANRPASKILLLVTDGEINWRSGDRDFDWQQSPTLNPRLKGQFMEEPLWVDLR